MSVPPNVGPKVTLLLQRLDLIEKKIDWVAQRITWLTYNTTPPTQVEAEQPKTEAHTPDVSPSKAAEAVKIVDDYAAKPSPESASFTAETTPPASTPVTSTANEAPKQDLTMPPAQVIEEASPQDEEADGTTAVTASSAPPHTSGTEEPTPQRHEEPNHKEHSHYVRSSSLGSTGYGPTPSSSPLRSQSFQGEPAGTVLTGTTEVSKTPGWMQRAMREGNLGRYLLSGAAAVLVLSAGASLLGLVWDSIPDPVKILALSLIAVTMTAIGARLGISRPRYRVAAATITGTGGGLGFVSIVGAVLLDGMLSPGPALALMACWGLVLLIVSHLTRVLFTAVVSAIGALVTIGFAVSHVAHQPRSGIVTWLMIGLYVAVLALTCGFLSRGIDRMRLAAWYPATSLVATVAALVFAPIRSMLRISAVGGTAIVLALCLLLVCQMMHASKRLWSIGIRAAAGPDWALAAAALLVTYRNLLMEQVEVELAHSTVTVTVTFILQLLLLAGAALAILAPHSPDQWRSTMAIGHEASFFPLALVGMAIIGDPRTYLFVVLTAMLCFLPAIVSGRVEPAPMLALLGTAPILSLPGNV